MLFSPAKVRGKVWHTLTARLRLFHLAAQGSMSVRAVLCVTGSPAQRVPWSPWSSASPAATWVTHQPKGDLLSPSSQRILGRESANWGRTGCGGNKQPQAHVPQEPSPSCPLNFLHLCEGLVFVLVPVWGERAQESKFSLGSVSPRAVHCWKALECHRPSKLLPSPVTPGLLGGPSLWWSRASVRPKALLTGALPNPQPA